ncbi:isoniazid response ATPase/transcriptional regulator IniR [Mycolicibacterium komossense]|uniref:LuxR family transcriptional regulator n=1 Tax=Mycolicibacterium komossense TaxID=1779 RepID=A0ABT3CFT8_9MYCO|nr:isoniazid response ATPase/transcriptional regulator IniR [Mycolicibacterium komossense]MCV7228339.1 LuxR family transcriptional regulator [Mycolicibacterium komossense]
MSEVPSAAQEAVRELVAAPETPLKLLVTGGVGTGKSTVLAAVRDALRATGTAVLTRPPATGDPASAIVIDDAHLLADEELHALTECAADPAVTLVVAAERHDHRPSLRALATTIERERPRVALGAWSRAELSGQVGIEDTQTVTNVMAATAGLPFLVESVLATDVAGPAPAIAQTAFFALTDRLRSLDDRVLETMLIASLSPELGPADVAAALSIGIGDAHTQVDLAHATGLLDPSHGTYFLATVHRALGQLVGTVRHHDIESALLRSQAEMSTLSTGLALQLAEHGVRDPQLASVLATEAAQLRGQPDEAARLYQAAMDAGAANVAAPLADALAMSGDCAGAAALADTLLSAEDPAVRAASVRIAASVAMHDGNSGQAAELFAWLGPQPDAVIGAAGAVVLTATGDLERARDGLRVQDSGPPTSAARTARSLAEGLLLTVDQPYAVAVARLGQAIGADQPATEAMPDSPAALVTLAALHSGDPARARSVIGRAARSAVQDGMFSHRHRLLLGWVRMQDGQLQAAAADVASVPDAGLHRRDALWAAALRTGIARRGGDAGGVQKNWHAAMEVLAEYSIDLFSLLPLGEIWVSAARLRQVDRLSHTLDQAFGLLSALGNPLSWSLPLHWAGVHAAILANSPESMAPHGQALTAAAGHSGFAKALAGGGRAWLRVLANQIDVDDVSAAAHGLAQFGLTWDATRLAGQAALQAPDPRVSGAMLQVARDLKSTSGQDLPDIGPSGLSTEPATPTNGPPRPTGAPSSAVLSEREREVAELLLLGMPYRDIGAQLFISAKTVEHHVARIRRRLGADSRSEMLSMLRAMLTSHS